MLGLHEPVSLDTGYYRVLLYDSGTNAEEVRFTLWVGNNVKRFYSEESLPDFLRNALAVITSAGYGANAVNKPDNIVLHPGTAASMFLPPGHPPEAAEVGWRASYSYYCLVISETEFCRLSGL